jgi:tRNA dimethylallyltransferase
MLPIEAVSADSRQIYRGMDIGTGKPSAEEQAALAHHLIDVVDPDERYHAARFRTDALVALAGIRGRGRLPVVVGGTGLYVRALLKGLRAAPPADPALREELDAFAGTRGVRALHDRLAALDPAAAQRLHPNDRVRIVRAIEVLMRGAADARGAAGGDWTDGAASWRLLMVGLRQSRDTLRARLADRARTMLARGMMNEVERLLGAGYGESLPAMDGIGYRQCCAALRGDLAVEEALRLMIRDTVRYAKRQMTWFARDPEIRWIDVDAAGGADGAAEAIAKQVVQEGLIE